MTPPPGSSRRPSSVGALPRGVRIVHEDDDVIVADKPPGLVTADPRPVDGPRGLRGRGRDPTLFDALKLYVRRGRPARAPRRDRDAEAGRTAAPPLWVLHRLDKEASGLVVFAKTERAFGWLKDDFKAKRMHRIYLAVAEGELGKPGDAGTHQSMIREDRGPAPASAARRSGPRREEGHDKLAITHYRVLGVGNNRTLLEARLETGRKNQIRIHMNELGHPLIGDRRFGGTTNPIGRLALHAAELGFTQPATSQMLLLRSPAPESFYRSVGMEPPVAGSAPATPAPQRAKPARGPEDATSWQAVAGWYDDLLAERGSDHYEEVILPGTLRLLEPREGLRVLDVACGQGILARRLAAAGCEIMGVDAAEGLIGAAKRRAAGDPRQTFRGGDARALWETLPAAEAGTFDAAACVMALSNIDSLEPVMAGVARALRPGGVFVFVITHPAFRAIGQTSWGWDERAGKQYRRVEGYLSTGAREVEMQPGKAAHGKGSVRTLTFHRPLQAYVAALSRAGLLIERLEEWPSLRASSSGPRAPEENRARREIPLFLGVRAVSAARAISP